MLVGSPAVALASASRSNRAQARELYAPVVAFNHATTHAQRAHMKAAPKAFGHRVDRCQAPYAKHIFGGTVNSSEGKLQMLYDNGALIAQNQTVEAVVAPQLKIAAESWATMRLPNRNLQSYARAQAAEIDALLVAPALDPCVFLPKLARHKFSLAWAERSTYGRITTRYWHEVLAAAKPLGKGWQYTQKTHLFTSHQLAGLVNFPGIIS
jgi:hypothetical protein